MLVRRVQEGTIHHAAGGEWKLIVYANTVEYTEHLVLLKGDLSAPGPVPVRMHQVDLLDDMTAGPHWIALHRAMAMIAEEGRGAVVLLREPRKTALSERVAKLDGINRPPRQLRDYGIGAQILLDLGVRDMVLLSNTRRTIIGLEGYGLNIVEQRPVNESANPGGDE